LSFAVVFNTQAPRAAAAAVAAIVNALPITITGV
jgi:hypothetical protein